MEILSGIFSDIVKVAVVTGMFQLLIWYLNKKKDTNKDSMGLQQGKVDTMTKLLAQVDDLTAKVVTYSDKIVEQDDKNKQMKEEQDTRYNELKLAFKELTDKFSILSAEAGVTSSKLTVAETKLSITQEELQVTKDEFKVTKDKLSIAETTLCDMQSQMEVMKSENMELTERVEYEHKETIKLRIGVDTLTQQLKEKEIDPKWKDDTKPITYPEINRRKK